MNIMKKFDRLDHTLCMNSDKLQFGMDDCDCRSMEEMVDCLEYVEENLKAFEIIKEKILDWDYFYYAIASNVFFTKEEMDLLRGVLK